MPVFEYTALDIKGKSATGILDAESASMARQKLRTMQKFPVSIHEVADLSKQEAKQTRSVASVFYRVKQTDIAAMTRQLATLIGAGFPLVSAIDALIPQTASKAFKPILAQIKDAIVEGNSFAGALANYPAIFTSLYINMVRAGESSGTLEIVLEQLADITEKQQALKTRIRSALAYPVLMACVGILVLFLLITFIVPNITSIFEDMEQVLPLPTILLIDISNFFKKFWWGLLVVLVLIWLGFRSFKKTTTGRHMVDKAKLRLPLFGPIFQKLAVARFTRTLGSLLENSVTLLTSLEIVKNIAGNTQIAMAIEHAADEVSKGQGLGNSLAASTAFPQLSIQMIQVGEQSGELENLLLKIATMYENEVESRVMSVTSLLEPVMILVMGIVLGFVVLSICLPIFEMNQLIM
ncbi:MAG: type II secretion system inner membrane protein GspF [Deltaproteobacteria bacterium]|jgi:general secretion pathway protein F|nr:type II secretion system inner membrane protein GspF [Deltaproteobacteria bacterium]